MIHFDKDELIIKEIRGPRIAILLRVFIVACLALFPLFILSIIPAESFSFLVITGSTRSFFIFSYALWLLLVWVDFFVWWMRYYLHTLVLTDTRIFDLTKRKTMSGDVFSVRLEDIEDIKISYKNTLKKLSQVGKITLLTTGTKYPTREIVFDKVFEPESIRQLIQTAQRARQEKFATVKFSAEVV